MMAAVLAVMPTGSVLAEDMIIEYEDSAAAAEAPGESVQTEDGLIVETVEDMSAEEESSDGDAELGSSVLEVMDDAGQADGDEDADDGSIAENEYEEAVEAAETETDSFVMTIEEEEAPEELTDEAYASEDTELPEMIVTGQLEETGYASGAVMPRLRMFSRTTYTDSYGSQLEGLAAEIYADLKAAYVTTRGCAQITHEISTPYRFSVPDLEIVEVDGTKTAVWDQTDNEEYQEVLTEIRYGMQSAYDAFIYDYPEVFWLAAPGFSWSIGFTGTAENGYTGRISKIVIRPNECYTGAGSEIAAFDSAVDAATAEISAGLAADASREDILEAVHDYLCDKVSYAENSYAHTAAGVFLKDKIVVCEGYAKAFKILCQKFGISCVLIPGGAAKSDGSIEGHMWNHVQMEDGNWYLVDVTWDDQGSRISKTYFLAGSTSKGFNGTIDEERTAYQKFSGDASYAQSFVMPSLSLEAYGVHSWNTIRSLDWDTSCTEAGQTSIHCSVCDAVKPGSEKEIPMTDHTWDAGVVTKAATCGAAGVRTYTCTGCSATKTETIPILTEHVWNSEKTVDQEPTCTAKGLQSIHCSICDTVQEGSTEQIAKKSHSYGSYVVTKAATVLEQGEKTRTCSVCKKTQTAAIAKLKRTMTVNVSSVKLQVGQSTTKVKVSGLGLGDSVASWKSSNKKVVAVSSTGKIRAKKAGTATVTITLKSGLTKKIKVTVQEGTVKTTKISGLKSSVTIKKGKTLKLSPTITPITSQEKVTYTSKNTKVATVSSKGVITAVGPGTTKIVVRSGSKKVTVKVTVPVTKKKKITAASSLTIKKGSKKTLTVKLTPSNSDQAVTFTSKNTKIATVNRKGKITAKATGTTYIIVKSGTVTKKCKITVK